jgi:hypothetical protein
VPEKYTQISEYQSWKDVVDWGLKVNSYPDLGTPLLDKTVQQLLNLSRNDRQKYIEHAIRFVQDEIRYMGIEMGVYSQRPHAPEQILTQRYGDCKDKSLLLIYLLKKQNIDAYMAYVDTYSGKRSRDFLPSPFLFDHAVVVVEYNNIKTWIDPTISNQRGNFNTIYFPNYGQALVLKPGVDQPEDVISIPTGSLVADLNFNIPDTAAGSKATLIIKSTYTDNYADNIRSTIEDEGTDGLEKSFLEYISKYYPEIENKGNIIIKDDEGSNTINITESYLIGNIWLKSEKPNTNRYIHFYGDLIDYELRTVKDKNRKAPFSLKYPVNVEENITVQLPGFWKYDDQSIKVETDNYYFEFNRFSKGNKLKINYSYRNFKDHIEAADINQYVKDSKKISNNLSTYIEYKPMAGSLNYNLYLILLAMLTVLISAFYFLKKCLRPGKYDIQEIVAAPAFGGWLVLAAIGILFSPLLVLLDASQTKVFALSAGSPSDGTTQVWLKGLQVIKIVCFSIQFCWSILIIALFFKKREILPQQYSRYLYFRMSLIVFSLVTNLLLNFTTTQPPITGFYIFGSIFALAICMAWVNYFKRSARVKQTFVFTYPEMNWKIDRIKYTNALVRDTYKREKEPSEL